MDLESRCNGEVSAPGDDWSSYIPVVSLYLTNARSSFCRLIPVNWATTIDLNPVALSPSACKPCIPNTDLMETLKM